MRYINKMNFELTTSPLSERLEQAILVSPGGVRDETKNGFVAD